MTVEAFAPGRVNIIGEHVDYNGGLVLPMAIHLGCRSRVTSSALPRISITSVQRPGERIEIALDDLAPGCVEGWASYVAGACWAVTHGNLPTGLDVVIDADVPAGAGLSSSAAVECSVAAALDSLLGLGLDPREIARRAQMAENDFVGVPTGSMDQVASMLAERGSALLFDVAANTVSAVPIAFDGYTFVVIDTRAKHALVDGGYAARRANCERSAAILGVTTLREVEDLDIALATLAEQPDGDVLVRRTRHVVTEIARVVEAVDALGQADARRLGTLMCASHVSLRDDYQVSCPELDIAVDSAMAAGAVGARMTGGGFGGSALALVRAGQVEALERQVTQAFGDAGYAPPRVLEVYPGSGACLLGGNPTP